MDFQRTGVEKGLEKPMRRFEMDTMPGMGNQRYLVGIKIKTMKSVYGEQTTIADRSRLTDPLKTALSRLRSLRLHLRCSCLLSKRSG